MGLFIKLPEEVVPPEKNSVTAMLIYEALKDYNGEVSAVFSYAGLDVPISWIKWVRNDALRIESEMKAMVIADPEISTGEVTAALSSDYLTISTVGTDIIHYNPTFDEARTFVQFKIALLGL